MHKDNRDNVYKSYEKIVDWFDAHRSRDLMEKEYLDLVVQAIPKDGSVLDLGCGMGEPLAKFFIEKGYQVTGIDASRKMIALCQQRFPEQRFFVADMRNIELHEQFDAIIAWDSFFHLPQDDQRAMFKIFAAHIKPQGILVFTSGPESGEVWGDNGGQNLYHASLSADEYNHLLQQHSFRVIQHKLEDPECGDHTVWVAQSVKE